MIDCLLRVFFFAGSIAANAYYSARGTSTEKINAKKIIVLHFDGSKIGDAVLSTVVFSALKERFPNAEIHAMYNPLTHELVENNPLIKKVWVAKHLNFFRFLEIPFGLKLRKEKFGLCISMTYTFSSHALAFLTGAKYRVGWDKKGSGFLLNIPVRYVEGSERKTHETKNYLGLLEPLGIRNSTAKPVVFASEEANKKAEEILKKNNFKQGMPLLGMHAGSTPDALAKRWPKENFAELAELAIKKNNALVLLFGAKNEKQLNEEIISLVAEKQQKNILNLAGLLSISETIAMAKKARVFVCNDSAPMHIAAAAGCYTVALFGPTDESLFGPVGNIRIITSTVPCRPCYFDTKKWSGTNAKCSSNECMKRITVEKVSGVIQDAFG